MPWSQLFQLKLFVQRNTWNRSSLTGASAYLMPRKARNDCPKRDVIDRPLISPKFVFTIGNSSACVSALVLQNSNDQLTKIVRIQSLTATFIVYFFFWWSIKLKSTIFYSYSEPTDRPSFINNFLYCSLSKNSTNSLDNRRICAISIAKFYFRMDCFNRLYHVYVDTLYKMATFSSLKIHLQFIT